MSSEEWIPASDAARILHMSERQVNRYGADGKIHTRRAGRRVLYLADDVTSLADELRVDIRPAPASRAMIPPELARYIQEQGDLMRAQGESQASIDRRLEAIERRLAEPAQLDVPRWLLFFLAAVVVLLVVLVVLFAMRG